MNHLEKYSDQFDKDVYQDLLIYIDDLKTLIKASEQIELIDFYTRKENGEVRSTIHFKTR